MSKSENLGRLPDSLPKPIDDGACDHLLGRLLPSVLLHSTSKNYINPSEFNGRVVIYCYPLTGLPGVALPEGWDNIPGARGCTPQSCAFRDNHHEFRDQDVSVFGLSVQNTHYQTEVVTRLGLPYEILSDSDFLFTKSLELPTFKAGNLTLIKRLTLITSDARIEKVFYPVFPPDRNASDVADWIRHNPYSYSNPI